MRIVSREFSRRPRLGVSLAVTAVILLVATLVPFRIDRTVGYELAVAGVSKDVAQHSEQLFELLHRLGVDGAEIEVVGCDTTCNLKISRLATADDMDLVRAAFGEIGKDRVEFFAQPVTEKGSGNLIDVARQRFRIIEHRTMDSVQIHAVVEEILSDQTKEYNAIFFGAESPADDDHVSVMLDRIPEGASADIIKSGDSTVQLEFAWVGDSSHFKEVVEYLLEDGELPDALQQELRDRQLNVVWISDDSGVKSGTLIRKGDNLSFGESDSAATKSGELPDGYSLSQNYPNPFNPTTSIDYSLPTSQHVTIEVFNINGRKVKTLVDEVVGAGSHTVTWNATSDDGSRVASGIYLYRFIAGDAVQTNKMTLLK